MQHFINELRRRKVIGAAGVYAGLSWLIIQLGIALETSLNLPTWFDTFVTTFVLVGFPIAMIFTWIFDVTAEGIRRTPELADGDDGASELGKSAGLLVLVGLAVILMLLGWQVLTISQSDSINRSEISLLESMPIQKAENTSDLLPSIAVLAFDDFSQGKDQGYFADGISEDLLNILAKTDGLKVTSRTSSFSFKGKNMPVSEIGKALNVANVLEGSIRKAGNMLRINAQLIKTTNDEHIWSESYQRTLTIDNVFDIQDEISRSIAKELKVKLNVIASGQTKQPSSLLAYELYLNARENMLQRQPATLEKAINDFNKAIDLDPTFAAAYSGLADALLLGISYSGSNKVDAITNAKTNLLRAIELAPNSFDSLIVSGTLAFFEEDWPKVIRFSNQALAINPNSSYALVRLANGYAFNGQPQEALEALEKAQILDPLDMTIVNNLAHLYVRLGQNHAVKQLYADYKSVNPDFKIEETAFAGYMDFFQGNYAAAHLHWSKRGGPIFSKNILDLYQNIQLQNFNGGMWISADTKAKLLVAKGDFGGAKVLLPKINDTDLRIEVSYLAGDFEQARNFASDRLEAYLGVWAKPGIDSVDNWTLIYSVMRKSDQTGIDILKGKLDTFFEQLSQTHFSYSVGIMAAATFYALNDNENDAYLWLNRFVDLGHSTYLLIDPAFDKLRNSENFINIQKRNAQNASRHRVAIQAQLEDLARD